MEVRVEVGLLLGLVDPLVEEEWILSFEMEGSKEGKLRVHPIHILIPMAPLGVVVVVVVVVGVVVEVAVPVWVDSRILETNIPLQVLLLPYLFLRTTYTLLSVC